MTAILQRHDYEAASNYDLSDFGIDTSATTNAQSRVRPRNAVGASVVLTGVALLGGLTGTSHGGQTGTVNSFVTVGRTDRGELVPFESSRSKDVTHRARVVAEARSDRDEVTWIKDHSGLTWEQLGKVFGVSRRAVHMWANGGRLNESNARRLREFSAIIRGIESSIAVSTPEATRSRLLEVEADGLSIVDRLRLERASGPTWGAPFGPERLVDAIRGPLRTPVGEVDK